MGFVALHDAVHYFTLFLGTKSGTIFACLVGNVLNILAMCRPDTPHSHDLGDIWNVANAMTGFMAESHVGLDIYLVFFYLDIYMVIFFLLHNSKDVSIAPTTGTGHFNCRYYPHIARVPT